MSFAAWTMFGLFFLWSFLGMPIGNAMLASAIVYLLMTGQDIALVATQSLNGLYGSFVLLAVPLFILSAEIMNAGQAHRAHVRLRQHAGRPLQGRARAGQHRRQRHLLRHERLARSPTPPGPASSRST